MRGGYNLKQRKVRIQYALALTCNIAFMNTALFFNKAQGDSSSKQNCKALIRRFYKKAIESSWGKVCY